MARRIVLAILAIGMLASSGCLGTGGPDAPAEGLGDSQEDADGGANVTRSLRFDVAPANSTFHANGTFPTGPQCAPASCGAATDVFDVSDRVSAAIPTLIRATLVADEESLDPMSGFDLALVANDARVFQHVTSQEDDRHSVYAVLVRGDEPVQIRVTNIGFVQTEDATYSLEVEFVVDPTLVYPSVPTGVNLKANQTVRLVGVGDVAREPASGGPVKGVVYDPDGAAVDRIEGDASGVEMTLPADAPAGEYVLLLAGGSAPVRAETQGGTDGMRLVAVRVDDAEAREIDGAGTAEWEFTVAEPPVAVGVRVVYEDATVSLPVDSYLKLTGPDGVVLETSPGCGGCFAFGGTSTYSYAAGYGDPAVVEGVYEVEYESDKLTPTSISEFVVWFDR